MDPQATARVDRVHVLRDGEELELARAACHRGVLEDLPRAGEVDDVRARPDRDGRTDDPVGRYGEGPIRESRRSRLRLRALQPEGGEWNGDARADRHRREAPPVHAASR